MKYLKWASLGLVPMLGAGLWLQDANAREREALKAFCQVTHRGEPWAQTQARAAERQFDFVINSRADAPVQEYLATAERFGFGLSCRISVEQGHVIATRVGELGALTR